MKKNYIFYILLALGVFITGFTEMSLSQTRKRATVKRAANMQKTSKPKTSTTKRAAVSSTSTKRAAVNSASTKRAATSSSSTKRAATSSVSTKRVMSRSNSKRTAKTGSASPKTANYCPVSTLIKKVIDENGNEVYYSAKTTTCVVDENMDVIQWNEASKESYPLNMYQLPSWISKDNAVYLICKNGYVEDKVDGKATCVPYLDICPLNEVITKEGDKYIHPGKTTEVEDRYCRPLNIAKLRQLSKTEYYENATYNYNYAYDDINIFECPENSYSVSSNYTGLADACKPCPYMINGERVYASQGSTEKEACRPVCRENGIPVKKVSVKVGNAYICKPCDENGAVFSNNLCQTKAGYTCYENGTRCEKTLQASDCDSNASLIDNKCVCNEGYIGEGLKNSYGCHRQCDTHATMNMNDYSCSCNEGYDGDGYTCTYNPAPSGLTASDCVEGATFEDGKCVCPAGSFGDGLKDNATSPYCKYFSNIAGDTICKNTYNASNGQGTQIPRGCVADCLTGYYWGTN
ncbi:hypothetical protein HDR59_03195 [bacterium]|nr:hypothetical protein [bacterium]